MEIKSNLTNIQAALDTTCGEGVAVVDEAGYVDNWDTPTRWGIRFSAVGCYWDGNIGTWVCNCPTPGSQR